MITSANKSPKEKNVMQTLYLSSEQTKELVSSIGANAIVVFTYYVAIAHQTNPNMEDDQISNLTGLSKRTVKRTRLSLNKLGWFKRIKFIHKGKIHIMYIVGKKANMQHNLNSVNI